jgi:phage terminase small subunit
MTSYAIQLGLTPAARLRLNAEVSERKENPFDKLKNSD